MQRFSKMTFIFTSPRAYFFAVFTGFFIRPEYLFVDIATSKIRSNYINSNHQSEHECNEFTL